MSLKSQLLGESSSGHHDIVHFCHAVSQLLNILLAASVWMLCMVEGADTKENLVILRDEPYTIAFLHPRSIALEHFMLGNWNLWKVREETNEREGGEENRDRGREWREDG